MSRLEALFANLDRWRHFPNYQLERRADIFFSLYLREVAEEVLQVELEDVLIPELPLLKRELVRSSRPTDESVKVDYALFARDRRVVYFVELKTDGGSRREKQDEYLRKAREVGFTRVLEGLCSIARSTQAHQKYHHLLTALARLGFLSMPADLEAFLYPPRRGLSERLRAMTVVPTSAPIEIVYLQPVATRGDTCIDFATFAAHVERQGDPLSALFAAHLRRWSAPAGSIPP